MLLYILVCSIASYGSESWLFKNIDRKIEAFELWRYRRLLRISWAEKKTKEWILNKMDISERLLQKIAFIGHKLKGKDITSEEDQKLNLATTSKRFLVEEV